MCSTPLLPCAAPYHVPFTCAFRPMSAMPCDPASDSPHQRRFASGTGCEFRCLNLRAARIDRSRKVEYRAQRVDRCTHEFADLDHRAENRIDLEWAARLEVLQHRRLVMPDALCAAEPLLERHAQ